MAQWIEQGREADGSSLRTLSLNRRAHKDRGTVVSTNAATGNGNRCDNLWRVATADQLPIQT